MKIFALFLYITMFATFFVARSYVSARSPGVTSSSVFVKNFTVSELSQFNGSDLSKPIYIALDGNVYDVTSGKIYYQSGGVYHFLAGRDSTKELNIFGGRLIQKKYPIVGRLITN